MGKRLDRKDKAQLGLPGLSWFEVIGLAAIGGWVWFGIAKALIWWLS